MKKILFLFLVFISFSASAKADESIFFENGKDIMRIENYLNRIKEIQIEIENAEELNNTIGLTSLREEYDSLLEHLSESLGMSGKSRKVGSTVEKARTAVTWRIRSSIKKIQKVHPSLANHLSKSIRTGTQCSYKPELLIDWVL